MTEDHTFIDRENTTVKSKQDMIASWSKFFKAFPIYKNTFDRIESYDDIVIMIGHAYWSKDNKYDRAIWSARIRNDLVAEWRVYYDNDENRRSLKVI
jgi:predicted SnoaL-like aldol condensation-catalyzing enzyme